MLMVEMGSRRAMILLLLTSLLMVEMGSRRAAPTDTAREKEQHQREIL